MSEFTVAKTDTRLGIVFGWAIVSTENGKEYFDLQGDTIPESVATESFAEFMAGPRVLKIDHAGGAQGTVIFAFPMTADIAASLGVKLSKTGIIVGVKPDDQSIVDAFARGELRGFSIGGRGERQEVSE